jgi:hypothetical protein
MVRFYKRMHFTFPVIYLIVTSVMSSKTCAVGKHAVFLPLSRFKPTIIDYVGRSPFLDPRILCSSEYLAEDVFEAGDSWSSEGPDIFKTFLVCEHHNCCIVGYVHGVFPQRQESQKERAGCFWTSH